MGKPTKSETSAEITIADQREKDCFAFAEKINTAEATELKKVKAEYISVPKDFANIDEKDHKVELNFICQKYLFYNRCRFKRCVIGAITCLFLLIYPLTACAGETNNPQVEKLPWGVFPLNNDVRFIQTSSWDYGALESILDPENGKPIAVFSKNYVRTEIFSFRKIGENKAEMYSTSEVTLKRKGFDLVNGGELQFQDSTWAEPIKLIGWFTLEENKVYYQYSDEFYGTDNFLYFDFDLKLNDTFRAGSFSEYQYNAIFSVASIDSVLIANEYRKRYKCVPLSEGFCDFYVVEGIGSLGHLFEPLDPPPASSTIVSSKKLEAMYYKDRLIWGGQ